MIKRSTAHQIYKKVGKTTYTEAKKEDLLLITSTTCFFLMSKLSTSKLIITCPS